MKDLISLAIEGIMSDEAQSIFLTLAGRLGKNPVKYANRQTKHGQKDVAKFDLAIQNGKGEAPTWVTVSAWDTQAEIAMDKLRKGQLAAVRGVLRKNTWIDKSGKECTKLELGARYIIA